jgi:hypothetical protein
MKYDIESMIPELRGWNNGAGISIYAWICGIGRYDHALGYSTILWPEFTSYEDCVFRRSMSSDTYQDWLRQFQGDLSKVEITANHLHLIDLFPGSEYNPTRSMLICFGKILKDTWSCKLAKDFPAKNFEVHFTEEAEDILDIEITFCQRRSRK